MSQFPNNGTQSQISLSVAYMAFMVQSFGVWLLSAAPVTSRALVNVDKNFWITRQIVMKQVWFYYCCRVLWCQKFMIITRSWSQNVDPAQLNPSAEATAHIHPWTQTGCREAILRQMIWNASLILHHNGGCWHQKLPMSVKNRSAFHEKRVSRCQASRLVARKSLPQQSGFPGLNLAKICPSASAWFQGVSLFHVFGALLWSPFECMTVANLIHCAGLKVRWQQNQYGSA